ncbi:hypothetical protein E1J17_00820 [Kocuria rosea]|nr:hypothetical protein [Kocuria rosea]THE19459.1 hypothetical protein E1J17_00820 [Kocuria rosea]
MEAVSSRIHKLRIYLLKHLKINRTMLWAGVCCVLAALSATAVFIPFSITLLFLSVTLGIWSLTWRDKNLIRFCIVLSLLAVVLVPIFRVDGSTHGPHRLLAVAALAFVLLALSIRFRHYVLSNDLVMPLGALLVIAGFSTSFTEDNNEWMTLGVTVQVTATAIFLAVAARLTGLMTFFWKVIISLACAEAIYAVWEIATDAPPLFRGARVSADGTSLRLGSDMIPGIERAQGTFGHPLPLAFFLILSALVLILCFRWSWYVKVPLWVLIGVGVIVSGSRNALLLFVLLSALAYSKRALSYRGPVVVFALGAGILLFWSDISSQSVRLLTSGSFSHRVGALQSMEVLILERGVIRGLFGDGAASAPRLFEQGLLQDDGLQAIDNQLALTLAQQGVIGLLILLLIFLSAWRRSDMALRIILVGIFLECMIFDLLAWPSSMFFAWFFFALAFMDKRKLQQGQLKSIGSIPKPRPTPPSSARVRGQQIRV